jgi:hypothetical protein
MKKFRDSDLKPPTLPKRSRPRIPPMMPLSTPFEVQLFRRGGTDAGGVDQDAQTVRDPQVVCLSGLPDAGDAGRRGEGPVHR